MLGRNMHFKGAGVSLTFLALGGQGKVGGEFHMFSI